MPTLSEWSTALTLTQPQLHHTRPSLVLINPASSLILEHCDPDQAVRILYHTMPQLMLINNVNERCLPTTSYLSSCLHGMQVNTSCLHSFSVASCGLPVEMKN